MKVTGGQPQRTGNVLPVTISVTVQMSGTRLTGMARPRHRELSPWPRYYSYAGARYLSRRTRCSLLR